jgi:lantibiotic modifying enzyme
VTDPIWSVQPQGAGLPHGYCGTALFLAQLADLTGTERYAAVARRALAPLPGLLAALAARPADLPDIGAGFAGLGGIAYALHRLAHLLDDSEVTRWAEAAVDLAAAAAGPDPEPGVLDGDAGCLAAMLAVRQTTGSATAGLTARACADRLAARAPRSLPAGGLGAGAAGVGWALLRFAAAGGGPGYASAGLAALRTAAARCAAAPAGTGWCDELQGLALATADSPAAAGVPELARLLDRAVEHAVEHAAAPTAGNHSLGAGAAGALDLLLVATRAGHADPGVSHPPAGALLAALDRFGPRCATPDSVSSPGLLTGLAGIGYELLRLGFGARVPSVLLLQSPAS